ncbi:ATP-binding protein [Rhizobacter fulvus]
MIDVTKYYPTENSDYQGNPLISLLPSLNPETLSDLMSSPIKFFPERRDHADHLRVQYMMGLMEFYIPLQQQQTWAWSLWSLICEGYKRRNPLKVATTSQFNAMCESIVEGQPLHAPPGNFLESKWCSVLIGTPGVGKSATVNAVLERLGSDLYHHKNHGHLYQQLAVRIQPAKNTTGKGLALQIFTELRDIAKKTEHFVPHGGDKVPETEPLLLRAIEVLSHKLNLGILVLDELQHLYRGTGAMDEDAMKFLTSLVNKLQIPMLFVGTWPCLSLLSQEGRLSRRAVSPAGDFFRRMPNDEEWYDFLGVLFRLQYTRKPVELNKGISDILYHHTQGIQDLTVKLFVMVQIAAMGNDSEEISMTLIDTVARNQMPVVAPWIRQMQLGKREDDVLIYDAEPVDFKKYIELVAAKAALNKSRRKVKGSSDTVPMSESAMVYQIAEAVVAATEIGAEDAQSLATESMRKAPHKSVSEHVFRLLGDARPKGPQPTKATSASKQAKVFAQFEALDDEDLRKVAFLALHSKASPEQALRDAGLVVDALADIPF